MKHVFLGGSRDTKNASMMTKSKAGVPGKTYSEDFAAGRAGNFAVLGIHFFIISFA